MIPEPLDYVVRGLVHEGALVEHVSGGFDALLPDGVARALDVPETLRLVANAGDHGIACGLGTPLLERIVAIARARIPVACGRLTGPPRLGHARALAERFTLRNAVSELVDASVSDGVYLEAWVAWSAEADDRFEGVERVVLEPATGSEPDASFRRALELEPMDLAPAPRSIGAGAAEAAEAAATWLVRRIPVLVDPALVAIQEGVARRHARDHRRIAEYFADLAREAANPRRRIEPAALAAKLDHLANERDGKLAELRERYALRFEWRLAAARWVLASRATVRLRVRRRKAERELDLHLPAFAAALDRPACAGCSGPIDAMALCDERLHGLCERCAPTAQGRLRCPACAPRSRSDVS